MAIPITSHSRAMQALMIIVLIAMNTHSAASVRPKPPPPAPEGPTGPVEKGITETFDFIKFCALYMHVVGSKFINPNPTCCASAKKLNLSQFCHSFFIPITEKVFSPRKVAHVGKFCNNPIPVGTKCGSYIVKDPLL